jgi:5-methylthioadenosine/S-adenosylhomocysteine deaminase
MNGPPIPDGAVLVAGDRIEQVTVRSQLPSDVPREEHPKGILLPAFVNAHTHIVYTAFRGLADDADFYTWITRHIIPLGIGRPEAEWRDSARRGIAECFRNGITALGEQHYTLWGRDAMLELGMKGVYFYEVFGLTTLNLARSVERDRAMIENLAAEATDRLRAGVAPHAPYSVTPPMAAMARETAEKHRLPISTHIAETRDEIELFLRGEGKFASVRRAARIPHPDPRRTPLRYFDELALLTPRTLIVHGVHLSDSDLNIIAERGCTMVTCPTSNAKLGAGIARVHTWTKRGIRVCIATDSPASGETFDLFEEMRRFVLMQRAVTGETGAFPAEQVIRMVTINPAKALGMEEMVGDLREGSCADMIVVEPDRDSSRQYRDAYQTLLWDITREHIVAVWADGREVYRR